MSNLNGVAYMRGDLHLVKVECPRNAFVKPGHQPYIMERIPALKNIKESDALAIGRAFGQKLELYRPKKDAHGNKIPNPNSFFMPQIAKSLAREKIFSPTNAMCDSCKRCVTG